MQFSGWRGWERIPRIWRQAYLYLCLWFAVNYGVSTVMEWKLERPFTYVLWNGLYLFEALIVLVIGVFFYARWLFRFPLLTQLIGHIVGLFTFFLIMGSLSFYFEDYLEGYTGWENWKGHMAGLLRWQALNYQNQYLVTVAVIYVIQYFLGLQNKEQEKSELALKNKEMQISLLKSQINPHFLFNTLNSISTLMNSSKEQARKVITQLSDIFRYALDSSADQKVRLIHEIGFIENYIRIQQVRFGDRLRFVKEVDSSCLGLYVPPMILQPLVENSVKYGIAPKAEGGTISLIVAWREGRVYFEVKDDGLGTNAKKVMDSSSSGVGMTNTDKRLKNYYGAGSSLIVKATAHGYSVSFSIPDERPEESQEQSERKSEPQMA
jgi:sensor histidine kinase YesM